MKRLLATLILVVFALAGFFHGSHIHCDQEVDLSINQSYMSQYLKTLDVVVFPMITIAF